MKQLIIGLSLTYLSLFVPFISNAQQATLDSTDLKLVLLEKQIYDESDISIKQGLLFQKGIAYKANEDFPMAIETFKRIYPQYLYDSLKFELYYEQSLAHFLIENYNTAEFYLLKTKNLELKNSEIERRDFIHLLLLHENRKWAQAQDLATQTNFIDDTQKIELIKAYKILMNLKLKDPEKAENISRILPGVGQMYAGKFWRGLTSSTLQLGLISFAGYSFINGFYFSGSLTGVSLFYVFYMGGARHAGYLAIEKNKALIGEYLKPIEAILFEAIKKVED